MHYVEHLTYMPPLFSEHLQPPPNISFRHAQLAVWVHLESDWQVGCFDDSSQKNPEMQIPDPHRKQLPLLQSGPGVSSLLASSATAGLLFSVVVDFETTPLEPPQPSCMRLAKSKTGNSC